MRIRFQFHLALFALVASPLHGATVSVPNGDQIDDGTLVLNGTIDDGSITNFTLTTLNSGSDGARAKVRTPNSETVRVFSEDVGGIDTQTNWTTTFSFSFAQALDGVTVEEPAIAQTDWVDWTLSWTSLSGDTAVLSGNSGTGRKLYETAAPGGNPYADGSFASGTTWRFDDNDAPDETTGAGTSDVNWSIALPDGLQTITITATFHDLSVAGAMNVQDEGMDVSFSNATVSELSPVPEPSSLVVLGLGLVAGLFRRQRN